MTYTSQKHGQNVEISFPHGKHCPDLNNQMSLMHSTFLVETLVKFSKPGGIEYVANYLQ